jgi:hypothetical protein
VVKVSGAPGSSTVIGSFTDDAHARDAVQRLRAAGVADAAISVARRSATTQPPAEMPTLARVFWSGFWWSIAGGAVGALLGLIVGVLGWGLPGTPDNIAVQIASWAMFLHVAGALAGCYAALDTGDRFAHKADHHDASATLVRVRSNDAEASMRAARILVKAGGVDVEGAARTEAPGVRGAT